MGNGISLATRREITKQSNGEALNRLVAQYAWSRANARRQLTNALKRRGQASAVKRKPRASTYGYGMLRVLQRVWLMAGQPCGMYLTPHQALI